MYLSKQQVKQLFDKLIENFSGSLFVFDSVLSPMVKKQKRLIKHMSANFDLYVLDIRKIQSFRNPVSCWQKNLLHYAFTNKNRVSLACC